MLVSSKLSLQAILVFCISLSTYVKAASSDIQASINTKRKTYSRGDTVPVTCLNRTIETGEHITDDHGNLQYISFLHCNETNNAPLAFTYGIPQTQTCTIDVLSDEFYHLIEYFVHSDVPLSCRVPSYPLTTDDAVNAAFSPHDPGAAAAADSEKWTPLTIALQGTLQLSHIHLHTDINVLFHTYAEDQDSGSLSRKQIFAIQSYEEPSYLIASTAYSLPNPNTVPEGTKIIRNEPLSFTFNVGWIPGAILPGMVSADTGKPYLGVTDHRTGFSLLSFFAIVGSAGMGALGMLLYERRKRGRADKFGNGLLPTNGFANAAGVRGSGYAGYGGYGGYPGPGKRD